jgi:hypothetical protein
MSYFFSSNVRVEYKYSNRKIHDYRIQVIENELTRELRVREFNFVTNYIIRHPLIDLEIKLIELHKLIIHEEILPRPLDQLINNIRAKQFLMHPIIVDRQHLVVLDGMHRIAATQKLGCRFIPVCLIDYQNPHVVLGSWYRVIHSSSSCEKDVKALLSQKYRLKEHNLNRAQSIVENRKAIAALIFHKKCFTVHSIQTKALEERIQDIYHEIKKIEYNLQRLGFSIIYETDTNAFTRLTSTEGTPILQAPTVTKKEVITAALRDELFNHKTTRHMIPLRPMFLNIPLTWLYSNAHPKDINQKFVQHLSKKSYRRLPPGQVFDRRYDEELYIFS